VQRFRGGFVFKAHRLLHRSILGLRVIKKKKKKDCEEDARGHEDNSIRSCYRGTSLIINSPLP